MLRARKNLVVASAFAVLLGTLTALWPASAQALIPGVTIDDFNGTTLGTRQVTIGAGGGTNSFSGGVANVTIPAVNNASVAFKYTFASPVDLTKGGTADLFELVFPTASTTNPNGQVAGVGVTVDDGTHTDNASTALSAGSNTIINFGMNGGGSVGLGDGVDLTHITSVTVLLTPGVTNQPYTHNLTLDTVWTVNFAQTASQTITFQSTPLNPAPVGSQYTVAATGGPSGMPVVLTTSGAACSISGTTVSFTAAGTCVIHANQAGDGVTYDPAPEATQTTTVGKASQALTFTSSPPTPGAIGSTYTVTATGGGSNLPVTFSLDPSTTFSACTVAGSTVTFAHAGSCVVAANQAGNAAYNPAPQKTQTITVGKTAQTIAFTSTAPTPGSIGGSYPVAATGGASTNPVTFSLGATTTNGSCTVVGSTVSFAHAGTCVVAADQAGNADFNAAPQKTQTITVGETAQTIAFTSTAPSPAGIGTTYTVSATGGGSPSPVTFSVGTGTTNSSCTVLGSTVSFAHSGTCVVAADQAGDADHSAAGQKTQTITVSKNQQAITFTSTPASPAFVGTTYTVAALGGASGSSVTFSTTSPACTVVGSTVAFVAAGTCNIDSNQAGAADFDAAPQVTQIVTVAKVTSTVTVDAAPSTTVHGQQATATAHVTPALGGAAGTIQFSVDGTDLGAPVPLAGGTAAKALPADLGAGNHSIGAAFAPTDTTTFATSAGTGTVPVGKASTVVVPTITPGSLTAQVSTTPPGAGIPTGTVKFLVDGSQVGTAPLNGTGLATLSYPLPTGHPSTVAAAYDGDANFLASSDSTSRTDPTITASVTGKPKKSKAGWYRGTVTVTFACAASGSPLATSCPAAVTLKGNGADQEVTRTVTSANGGIGTASVGGINLDHAKPKVTIVGVKTRGHYPSAPHARCKGVDKLSGIKTCRLKQRELPGHRVRYTAVAIDKAGNKSRRSVTISLSVTQAHVSMLGLAAHDGAFDVTLGGSYTLVVIGGPRPRYVDAAVAPQQPSGLDAFFVQDGTVNGQPRWVLGVTITTDMGHSTLWNLGVLQGGHLYVVKVRVH